MEHNDIEISRQGIFPTEEEQPWSAMAACRGFDSAIFFPGQDGNAEPALRVCESCFVREDCLEYAIETRQRYGVWGGTTERQRRRILRRSA